MVFGLEGELSACKASVSSQCPETVIGTDLVSGKDWLGYFDSVSFSVIWSPCDFLASSFNISARFRDTTKVFCGGMGGGESLRDRKIRKLK